MSVLTLANDRIPSKLAMHPYRAEICINRKLIKKMMMELKTTRIRKGNRNSQQCAGVYENIRCSAAIFFTYFRSAHRIRPRTN